MKKILLLVAMATTFASAGYFYMTLPDGSTIECYRWSNGDVDCSGK